MIFFLPGHAPGLLELHVAVIVVVVVVVVVVALAVYLFLKCTPIGRTASGPHPHLSLDSTHHNNQTNYIWPPSWFSGRPNTFGL